MNVSIQEFSVLGNVPPVSVSVTGASAFASSVFFGAGTGPTASASVAGAGAGEAVAVSGEVVDVGEVVVVSGAGSGAGEAVVVSVTVSTHKSLTMVFEASVTAPLRANNWPSKVAPALAVMVVKAKTCPAKILFAPKVAEDSTCQKTLQA